MLATSCSRIPENQSVDGTMTDTLSVNADSYYNQFATPIDSTHLTASVYTTNFISFTPVDVEFSVKPGSIEVLQGGITETYTTFENKFYTKASPQEPLVVSYDYNVHFDTSGIAGIKLGNVVYLRNVTTKFPISSIKERSIEHPIKKKTSPKTNLNITYIVKNKDTWYSIARAMNMSPDALRHLNKQYVTLKEGDKLTIK